MFYNSVGEIRGSQVQCPRAQKAAAEAEQLLVLPARPSTCWYSKGHRRLWDFGTGNRSGVQESVGAMGKTEIQCFFLL